MRLLSHLGNTSRHKVLAGYKAAVKKVVAASEGEFPATTKSQPQPVDSKPQHSANVKSQPTVVIPPKSRSVTIKPTVTVNHHPAPVRNQNKQSGAFAPLYNVKPQASTDPVQKGRFTQFMGFSPNFISEVYPRIDINKIHEDVENDKSSDVLLRKHSVVHDVPSPYTTMPVTPECQHM
eukprot:TRINITY_DN2913_c0_g1_i1.p1 TRINITY_DN2913_c0_g1~~TRINITY_DN2913_c0_g1_i1.p1  ORF type:complete len:178 (+),score=14.34 TRINITY_DN2913_c0_g1_i1:259-792(+)